MNETQQPGTSQQVNTAAEALYEDEIDLAQLWALVWGGKWVIAAFIVSAIVCAMAYLFVTQSTYRADALLQIQSDSASPLQGISSDLGMLTGTNTSLAQSAIPIIKSRSVLGKAVNQLHLTSVAQPDYFPVIGQAIAHRQEAGAPVEKPVPAEQGNWLTHYAWQPSSIKVSRLDVPEALNGQPFVLRALGGGAYILFGPQGQQVLSGQTGKAATGVTQLGRTVGLFVRAIRVSAPPTDFTLVKRAWLPTVEGLGSRLSASEQGDDTGIIQLSLEGVDRQHITKVLNAIANNYLKQNVASKSKQAKKSLEFLDAQLPKLKADVRAAEAKLTNYRQSQNTIDLAAEGQALLDQVVNVEDARSKLALKLAMLKQTFTAQHPAIQAVQQQIQSLQQQRNQLKKKIGSLPESQKDLLRLRRDVKVNTQLYTSLLNRAQVLRVAKAGTVGNVRIIDHAVVPVRAVAPKKMLVLALAIVLGGMLGVGFIFLRAALSRRVDDPNDIEKQLGLPVYAVVPFSRWLDRRTRKDNGANSQPLPVLARDMGDDLAVEALRSLRTSLYFAQMEQGSNVVMMTGPTAGIGKTFVAANLAWLLAEVEQSVVIVDVDLRKGRLHQYLADQSREPGLSQVLTGQVSIDAALKPLEGHSDVQLLTTGQLPPNPAELLMRAAFVDTITALKQRFDMVIIDAPPILPVTDAAIIASALPGVVTFLVARAGTHPMGEIEESIKRLSKGDTGVAGVIFNAYKQTHSTYSGQGYYHYKYKPSGK